MSPVVVREATPPVSKEKESKEERRKRVRESNREERPTRGNAGEISRIQSLIKELERELGILKTKEPEVPEGFLKRMLILETK